MNIPNAVANTHALRPHDSSHFHKHQALYSHNCMFSGKSGNLNLLIVSENTEIFFFLSQTNLNF